MENPNNENNATEKEYNRQQANKSNNSNNDQVFAQAMKLMLRHCRIYIYKFIVLIAIAIFSVIILSDNSRSVIGSALTFTVMLFFDQLLTETSKVFYEFKKIETYTNSFKVFLFIICVVIFFCFSMSEGIDANIHLNGCRLVMSILMVLSSFSAIIEGILNIPEQALPSQQVEDNKDSSEGGE